jgi:hypothetical protein
LEEKERRQKAVFNEYSKAMRQYENEIALTKRRIQEIKYNSDNLIEAITD